MAYKRISPQPVVEGGTGAQTLTNHSVLVGAATSAITSLTVGTTGQLLVGASSADPAFGSSATGDFTFTSSTASATRTLTVSNTDNTSGTSNALILAKTGGASSGDAVHQASTTTTTWSWGVDNSVTSPTADPFVISQGTALGTNNIMSVSTSGQINYPLQPAFNAYLNTTISNATGDGTAATVVFDTELFDIGSNFDNTTGTFTAPVTGKYQLNCQMFLSGIVAQTTTVQDIVTTSRTYENCYYRGTTVSSSGLIGYTMNQLVPMTAGDTAIIRVQSLGSTKTVSIFGASSISYNAFSGWLVL